VSLSLDVTCHIFSFSTSLISSALGEEQRFNLKGCHLSA